MCLGLGMDKLMACIEHCLRADQLNMVKVCEEQAAAWPYVFSRWFELRLSRSRRCMALAFEQYECVTGARTGWYRALAVWQHWVHGVQG